MKLRELQLEYVGLKFVTLQADKASFKNNCREFCTIFFEQVTGDIISSLVVNEEMTRVANVVLFPSFGSKDEAPQFRMEKAEKSLNAILSSPQGIATSVFSDSLALPVGQEFLTTMQKQIQSYVGSVSLVKAFAINVLPKH